MLFDAKVIYVDTQRRCCDAITIDGRTLLEDISYVNTGFKESGEIHHIESGDVIVVELGEDNQAKMKKFYIAQSTNDYNQPTYSGGSASVPVCERELPGDKIISGPDGAFMAVLRGKLLALGAGPLAQTLYSGLEGLVRTICQNYDFISSGARVYTLNDGGDILTRICISSTDLHMMKGATDNAECISENFEYQIDFSKNGISFFVGEIDKGSGKRKNNLVMNIKQNGDASIICGDNIRINMYSNGGITTKLIDNSGKVVYNRSVATNGEKVLMKEILTGDVIRLIDGNLTEEVTGTRSQKVDVSILAASTIDNTSRINRSAAGVNIKDLEIVPNVTPKIR